MHGGQYTFLECVGLPVLGERALGNTSLVQSAGQHVLGDAPNDVLGTLVHSACSVGEREGT